MIRGKEIFENITKLNTFFHMFKSNDLLSVYIDKIINSKNKKFKFSNDFDYISLDLLYISLQIINNNSINKDEYNKIDKKELKYYLDKVKGISYFKNQVSSIKNEELLIEYLCDALAKGNYICKNNSTIKFGNGLIIESKWLIEFASFIITSLNNNVNLSNDGMTYSFYTVNVPKIIEGNVKTFIKSIKLYEYTVNRKDYKKLTFQDIKYLLDILPNIKEYDFKQLQEINSLLSQENFYLSVNKKQVNFTKLEKQNIEKIINEDNQEKTIKEYIQEILKCHNSSTNLNRKKIIENYELLRSLAHAYKGNYSLEECRKLFDISSKKTDILNTLVIGDFYINYIYDENNFDETFNYSLLNLDKVKPQIIDYETIEYKSILNDLSTLNKKVVLLNRKINKCLETARSITKKDTKLIKENNKILSNHCRELEEVVKQINILREELNIAKDKNRNKSNINKMKIKHIKDAIINGKYYFDVERSVIVFDYYSKKDYHHKFHLEISLKDFKNYILSEHNCNTRIDFYQI